MKKSVYRVIFLLLAFVLVFRSSKANVFTISADSAAFNPDSIHAAIGDTISWIWIKGQHTTSSNGIPDGAAPWNELLDSAHTFFNYVITKGGIYNYVSVPDIATMRGIIIVAFPSAVSALNVTNAFFTAVTNPVHNVLNASFTILSAGKSQLALYDISGKNVMVFFDEFLQQGAYEKHFPLSDKIAPGIYLLSLQCNQKEITKKVVVQ